MPWISKLFLAGYILFFVVVIVLLAIHYFVPPPKPAALSSTATKVERVSADQATYSSLISQRLLGGSF